MAQRDDDIDFSQRELCPDGACIGVIGSDGRCKECGKTGKGMRNGAQGKPAAVKASPHEAAASPADDELEGQDDELEGQDDDVGTAAAEASAPASPAVPDAPTEWDDRKLCTDGACIGLIGKDGRCSECGLRAEQS